MCALTRRARCAGAGEWLNDVVHGQGRCAFSNGNVYDGEWEDGSINGYGTLAFADGDQCVGTASALALAAIAAKGTYCHLPACAR